MIQLRETAKADAQAFFELDRICFDRGIAYALREFRSLLASSRTVGLVAEEDGELAGFAIAQALQLRGGTGSTIVTIDVAPGFRRRGVGRLLMAAVEAKLRDAGAQWLRLEVAVDNAAAREFYISLGFQQTGRIPGYYAANLDALTMEKSLSEPSI